METAEMTGLDRETLELLLKLIREFGQDQLPDEKLLQLDHDDVFPEEIVRDMCGESLGVQLVFIPEEFDGMGGGTFDIYRICEQLARIDVGVATGVFATFLGSDPIVFGGTPDQQKYWLSRLANEGLLMAYGATEPDAGSDLGALRTTAVPIEEDGEIKGYSISGSKQWISNGGYADLYTILAKTAAGPSWFVVERDAEGFRHGQPEDKHGIRASNTSSLTLQDVYVDADRLIGGVEGQGLIQAQNVFGYTRLMVAAFGLGGGWAALDRAIPYSIDRIQGGSRLSEKKGFVNKLIVPHAVHLESARAYVEHAAERIDAGEKMLNTEGAIAKYLATEFGNQAADASIQALGGYGYTREYMVEKVKRDVRITTIYEGTSEIMEMTIGRDRWQEHLKSRGQYYIDRAAGWDALPTETGGPIAALGARALAALIERARAHRLTRNQHVLFRLGEMIAWAETAGIAAERAARASRMESPEKTDRRFGPAELSAIARLFAREAALKLVTDGMRWITGETGEDPEAFAQALNSRAIYAAQAGVLGDMDLVADALYAPYAD